MLTFSYLKYNGKELKTFPYKNKQIKSISF